MNGYEMVIGLEVHVALKTLSKIFCGCSTAFGAEPNTQCCPICMGLPGVLPVLNEQVVAYAARAGLAANCRVVRYSKQDRKNYFYPDLPKAYQISQYDLPLCSGGYLDIETEQGPQRIGISRIHIEEDAGKLVHTKEGTQIDYNRCGVPLIEIVSKPDLRSAAQVKAYLQKLRAILIYTGVSDCRMNEGSFRCDVNLSARKIGEKKLGIRTEMKNLNSFQFINKAIEYEFTRQVALLEAGERILQQTRRFDQGTGKTFAMRKKEDADDYRYFPDPDLPPIILEEEWIDAQRAKIPRLPDQRKVRYVQQYGLTPREAEALVIEKQIADYFETAAGFASRPDHLAKMILSEAFRLLPADSGAIPIKPEHFAKLSDLFSGDKINSGAAKKLLQIMWENDEQPEALAEKHGLAQISDSGVLERAVLEAIDENPQIVASYKAGKEKSIQALIGKIMAKTRGRGNPALINEILRGHLK